MVTVAGRDGYCRCIRADCERIMASFQRRVHLGCQRSCSVERASAREFFFLLTPDDTNSYVNLYGAVNEAEHPSPPPPSSSSVPSISAALCYYPSSTQAWRLRANGLVTKAAAAANRRRLTPMMAAPRLHHRLGGEDTPTHLAFMMWMSRVVVCSNRQPRLFLQKECQRARNERLWPGLAAGTAIEGAPGPAETKLMVMVMALLMKHVLMQSVAAIKTTCHTRPDDTMILRKKDGSVPSPSLCPFGAVH